jgi:hypothetical protein
MYGRHEVESAFRRYFLTGPVGEDWVAWKLFNQRYTEARTRAGDGALDPLSRSDWGPWVDWARPAEGHQARPSWLGRNVPPIARMADMDIGARHPRPASTRRA